MTSPTVKKRYYFLPAKMLISAEIWAFGRGSNGRSTTVLMGATVGFTGDTSEKLVHSE